MSIVDLDRTLSRGQAARYVGCSPETITQRMNAGRLPYIDTPLGKLIRLDDLIAFKRDFEQRNMKDAQRVELGGTPVARSQRQSENRSTRLV